MPRKKKITKKVKEIELKDQVRTLLKRNEVWIGALTVFLIALAFGGSFFKNLSMPNEQKKTAVKDVRVAGVEKKKSKSLSKIKTLADTSGFIPVKKSATVQQAETPIQTVQPATQPSQQPVEAQANTQDSNENKEKEEKDKKEKEENENNKPKEESVVEEVAALVPEQAPQLP